MCWPAFDAHYPYLAIALHCLHPAHTRANATEQNTSRAPPLRLQGACPIDPCRSAMAVLWVVPLRLSATLGLNGVDRL
eukprot:scaffold117560_cov33-Tisochrysis_lutea.AAC.4